MMNQTKNQAGFSSNKKDFPAIEYAGFVVAGIGKFGYSIIDRLKPILRKEYALSMKIINEVESYDGFLQKAEFIFLFADIRNEKDRQIAMDLCEIAKKYSVVTCLCGSGFGLKEYNSIEDCAHTVVIADNRRGMIYHRFVKQFIELIKLPSLVGLEYADIISIIKIGKLAKIRVGKASGKNKVQKAVKKALSCLSKKWMNNMLILINGGQNLTLDQISQIGDISTGWTAENSEVIWSAQCKNNLKDEVEVFYLVTYSKFIKDIKGGKNVPTIGRRKKITWQGRNEKSKQRFSKKNQTRPFFGRYDNKQEKR